MRQSWTDDRLDDLSHRMDERFDQVEGQIADTRTEMRTSANSLRSEVQDLRGELKDQGKELREEIAGVESGLRQEIAGVEARLRAQASEHYVRTGEELAKVWKEFAKVHDGTQQVQAEIHALHRTMIRIGWTGMITLIAGIAGVLLTRL